MDKTIIIDFIINYLNTLHFINADLLVKLRSNIPQDLIYSLGLTNNLHEKHQLILDWISNFINRPQPSMPLYERVFLFAMGTLFLQAGIVFILQASVIISQLRPEDRNFISELL